MMDFSRPPNDVKVAFGIYLNFYLDNEKPKNENGIIDYQQVKLSVLSNPNQFLNNTKKLLDQIESGEYSELVSRLEKMCIAISKNKELYDICVEKAMKYNVAAGQVIKIVQNLA